MKIAISGGAPVPITDIQGPRGASWGADDTIVYTPALSSGLWRVSAESGEPEVLTVPDRSRREKSHRYPQVLPGGNAVLFTVGTGDITTWDDATIEVLSLETRERKLLIEGGTFGRYVATGHIVYGRGGDLIAVPFDLDTLEVRGSPVPVVEGVQVTSGGGNAEFGVTRNGALLYARQRAVVGSEVRWVGRDGRTSSFIESQPSLIESLPSPDGRYLAMWVEEANGTIFVHDIERGTSTRLISGFDNHFPVWTPSGRRLAFRSNREGPFNLYWQAADGSDEAERLTTSDFSQSPHSFSPDGKLLAFDELHPESGLDIWIVPIEGERSPEPYLQTQFNEEEAAFSPDGRFIAYVSNESGEREVYIQAYPSSGRKWRVSLDGSSAPQWNPQGQELFYRSGERMMVVDVDTKAELSLGTPRPLFETSAFFAGIMPDGQGFVTVQLSETTSYFADQLILVQSWTEELKRLVPTN